MSLPNSLEFYEKRILVYFDTNAFVSHQFNIDQFAGIQEIKDATGAIFLVSSVVLTELEMNFKRGEVTESTKPPLAFALKDRVREFKEELQGLLVQEWGIWLDQFNANLSVETTQSEDYDSAMQRVFTKSPPCHNRESFKDAVIWDSLLRIAQGYDLSIFVTDNTRDFPFGKNRLLDSQAKSRNVLHISKFNDLRHWFAPLVEKMAAEQDIVESDLVPFDDIEKWYLSLDVSDMTLYRLQDELPEHLMGLTPYYESDPEVFDLERIEWEITEFNTGVEDHIQLEIEECWSFSVSFSLSGDIRIGGSRDGLDVSASGSASVSGTATVTRRADFSRGEDPQFEVDVEQIEFDEDVDWEPMEHIYR